ncbi:MAG: DEAD/DEAH box helicase [Verrucomicrobia bacterium]|nr:DEAD/DEAH box helicase [Verrucomicrobiota bacterium]
MKFTDMELSSELLEGISALGFEIPTPVQGEVMPFLLGSRRDMVALAQTGTGKTAAFGLPILQRLRLDDATPQALILCPTRELCMQIARDLRNFSSCLPKVKVLAVYGGADIRPQLASLSHGVQIVVATPGRMVDLLRRKKADFSRIERVVLDEADEMLNMGFEEDLETILSNVPDEAQTLLFSATMPREVAKIAHKYMDKPEEITVGTRNAGAENVVHEVVVVHAKDRYRALRRIVDVSPDMYGIVFCRTRSETQQVADKLGKEGYNAEPLHGDLSQQQRDRVMKAFRERQVQILVATDVAARGLDVNDLTHVINYNLPDDLNSYTHRSGRTGRAGKEGISISIIHMREHYKVQRIEKALGKKFRERRVPTGDEIIRVRLMNLAEKVRDCKVVTGPVDNHIDEFCSILEDLSVEEVIKRFISIQLHHAINYYRSAPDLNEEPERHESRGSRKPGRDDRERHDGGKRMPSMVELVMNVGRTNGLTPKKLISLLNVADRDSSVDVGRINIVNMQAYFEVPRADAQGVIDSITRSHLDMGGRKVGVAIAGNTRGRPAQSRGPNRPGPSSFPRKRQIEKRNKKQKRRSGS